MLCQSFIHERVVRLKQIDHAAVLADHAVEQQFRLAPERLAQVVIEVPRFGPRALQLPKEQPLSREILYQCLRLRVRQHPPRLLRQHSRVMQFVLLRQRQ